ncbi:hypothetical protein Hdeb2414_s0005g00160711 [Helianthus debilis subsp. tardiflorus]
MVWARRPGNQPASTLKKTGLGPTRSFGVRDLFLKCGFSSNYFLTSMFAPVFGSNECITCQCDRCSCKATNGGYERKCKGDKLYIAYRLFSLNLVYLNIG